MPLMLRPEVQRAQTLVKSVAGERIDEIIALVAFLRIDSGTKMQLSKFLHDDYLVFELLAQAEFMNRHGDRRTPDALFE